MGTDKERIPRNQGRIEILACRETIESLVEQGFDRKKIFTRLEEKGAVTMTYSTFCRGFAKLIQPPTKRPAQTSVPTEKNSVPALPGSGPQIIGKPGSGTVIPADLRDKKFD